jgi:hypothetical protein
MKSVKDILRSSDFMRQVSTLLLGFGALSGIFAFVLLIAGNKDAESLSLTIGLLFQTIIYVALGLLTRRGSTKALWAAGILFTMDTLLAFVMSWEPGLGGMIIGRGLLIYILIRYVRRQRRALES